MNIQSLEQILELFERGKYAEALEQVDVLENHPDNTPIDRLIFRIHKGYLLNHSGKYEEALVLGKGILEESEKLGVPILVVDAFLLQAQSLWYLGRYEASFEAVIHGSDLLQNLIQTPSEQSASILEFHQSLLALLTSLKPIPPSQLVIFQGCTPVTPWVQLEHPIALAYRIAAAFHRKGSILAGKGELHHAIEHYQLSLGLKEVLGSKRDITTTLNNIGTACIQLGELEQAADCYQRCLTIHERLGNLADLGIFLNNLGIVYLRKGELNRALDCCQQSLSMKQTAGNMRSIAFTLSNLGEIYLLKGELKKALENLHECLEIFLEVGHKRAVASVLQLIGMVYQQKGELDQAARHFKQSLQLWWEIRNNPKLAIILFSLVSIAIDQNDFDQAEEYLQRLKAIDEKEDNKVISQQCRVAQAMLLKTSPRTRSRGEAEALLQVVVDEPIVDHEITVIAMLNLCDLLLTESRSTGDPDVLDEIEGFLPKIVDIAKQQGSYKLIVHTFLLEARLALIKLNLPLARRLFTQAQLIADEKGLHGLARAVSLEHDILLDKLDQWESLIGREAPLKERLDLAELESLVVRLIRSRVVDASEVPDEEPVLLLILGEGGQSLYSNSLLTGSKIDDDLLGSFLTAIHHFSGEVFQQTLDRAKLGKYTLLIHVERPLLICYVFTGLAYTAQRKLQGFVQTLRQSAVWEALTQASETGYSLQDTQLSPLEDWVVKYFPQPQ